MRLPCLASEDSMLHNHYFCSFLFRHFLSVLCIFSRLIKQNVCDPPVLDAPGATLQAAVSTLGWRRHCDSVLVWDSAIDILRHATLNRRKTWSREILSWIGGGIVLNLF